MASIKFYNVSSILLVKHERAQRVQLPPLIINVFVPYIFVSEYFLTLFYKYLKKTYQPPHPQFKIAECDFNLVLNQYFAIFISICINYLYNKHHNRWRDI